jgi:hypothetical protein
MKNPKTTQTISTQTDKQTTDDEPPPYLWNDNKDELGFDDDYLDFFEKRNEQSCNIPKSDE